MSTTSKAPTQIWDCHLSPLLIGSVPLENYVCREVIEEYFFKDQPFSQRRHVIVTASVVFSTMLSEALLPSFHLLGSQALIIVSLMTCDLGVVLEIAGGLSATALAFIVRAPPHRRR
jgi:sodium-coupled neutral amino acid transporter 11